MSAEPAPSQHNIVESPRNQRLGYLFGLIGVIIFSGTLPATRVAVVHFDPVFLTFSRALLASLTAGMFVIAMRKPFPRHHLLPLLFIGSTLVYAFPGFMALAMMTVPSSHGGVVLGILPLLTAIFAVLVAGERPSTLFWVCGVLGTVVIVIFSHRQGSSEFATGDFWLFAAGICASAGYVASGHLSKRIPGWEVICWALILTLPITLVGTVYNWSPDYAHPSTEQFISFLYLGLGSMFLGFFAWNSGLKRGGLAKIGQLQLLQTFFTLAIAAVLLGEVIAIETLSVAVIVFIIVLVGTKTQVKR